MYISNIENIFFYIFAILLIISATMVITSRNPVRAVLSLVLAFVASSGLWILLQAEYLAIVLLVVYVGAVMVLFLFVIMMLDIDYVEVKSGFVKYMPLMILIMIVSLVEIGYMITKNSIGDQQLLVRGTEFSNIAALGNSMFTDYIVPFEIAGIILLASMVAAVALTFRGPVNRKTQSPHEQVKVNKSDRLVLVDLKVDSNVTTK